MSDRAGSFGRFEAVVFDLDGTLVDTLPDIAGALNRLLAEERRSPLDDGAIRAMIGDGAARLVERALAATGEAAGGDALAGLTRRYLALYSADLSGRSRPYPGADEALDALRAAGVRLAVCTNKPEAPSNTLLADLGLAGYFAAVVGGDSLAVRKPDGRHLLATLARLGADAARAAMVGDNANDVAVARAAGVPVVLVSHGYTQTPARALGADAVIEHFTELGGALSRLGGEV